jgi:hypothetical protein
MLHINFQAIAESERKNVERDFKRREENQKIHMMVQKGWMRIIELTCKARAAAVKFLISINPHLGSIKKIIRRKNAFQLIPKVRPERRELSQRERERKRSV